jgi:hypothetical protein
MQNQTLVLLEAAELSEWDIERETLRPLFHRRIFTLHMQHTSPPHEATPLCFDSSIGSMISESFASDVKYIRVDVSFYFGRQKDQKREGLK